MKTLLCLIFIILFFVPDGPVAAQTDLILNTAGNAPLHHPDQTGLLDRLVVEAFARIDRKVSIQHLPPERGLLNANLGIEDGEAGRIGGLGAMYPNLVQVPTPVFHSQFVAFSNGQALPIRSWQDLQPYDVAICRGHKISEENVPACRSLVKAANTEILFTLLKNNRADVVVCERIFGVAMAQKLNLGAVRILEPPLASVDFFIYLNRKHEALVAGLAKALGQMEEDGTSRSIYAKFPQARGSDE